MKVNLFNENFYKNRYLLKGLEFAANNGALFVAGTTLTLSTIIRPLSIWATPKTDKENKKLALVKSLASSAGGYLLIMAASIPMARNVKKIDKNPIKYLTPQAIASLGKGEPKITDSKNYQFATQLFKLGLGIAMAVPKSVFTNLLISPFLTLNNKMKHKTDNNINSSAHAVFAKKDDNTSFKGKGSPANREPFTKFIAGVLNLPCIQKLRPDVLDPSLNADYLYQMLHHSNKCLKACLLDQSIVAGIGNIYADEICFACRLDPRSRSKRISKQDCVHLVYHMQRIIQGAIRYGGTTIRSYTSSLGVTGRFQLKLRVHDRKDEACSVCHSIIKKIVVAQRGTYLCPKCQKRK